MRNKDRQFKRLLLILMLLVTLSCDAVASLMPGGRTPTAEPPMLTDTPPPEDLPPLPPLPAPELLFRAPEVNELQALDAPVELVFDQPMDQGSVADAFSIKPRAKGELVWTDARTLHFNPASALDRGTTYQVLIDRTARNTEGAALVEPVSFDFDTIGFVEIAEVQPAPGSEAVDADTTVTVIFNRPIVPLTSLDRQGELPEPLLFDPAVSGEGEWLNTAIYRFRPEGGFLPATTYTARVASGLADTQGAVLEEAYSWVFTTVGPTVVAWSPEDNAEYVGPTDVISVTFNQPMDHASTEAAFKLAIDDLVVDGKFGWEGGVTATDEEILVFTPAAPLPRNGVGQVTIRAAARARAGQVTLGEDFPWLFWTIWDPGVLDTTPYDGAQNVEPYSDVEITFASPMEREVLTEYLTIIPEPTEVYSYWRYSDTSLRLSFRKDPATPYSVELNGDYPDKYGVALGEDLLLRFTTGDLSPYASLNTLGSIGSFDAYTDTVLYAQHRNVTRLDIAIYQLPLDTFMRLHGYGSYDYRKDFSPSPGDLIRAWSVPITVERNTTFLRAIDMVDDQGQQFPPGIYYVALSAPEVLALDPDRGPKTYTFSRSRINLVMKQANNESLVWATDLATGQPVGELPVRFFEDGWSEQGAGWTGDDGLWVATDLPDADLWDDYFAVAGEPGDEDFAIAYNDWDDGIRSWNFDLYSDYGAGGHLGYLYTDRPIYRPGQTVYFKGIVRHDDDVDYTIPSEIAWLDVRVSDPQGTQLYYETLPVSDMGTFFDELTLGGEAPLGSYFVQVQGEEWDFYASTSFRVAEYRAPEFQVTVDTGRDAYRNGESIDVAVTATYYFGGPVANAEVTWNVLSSPYNFRYACPVGTQCPSYSWTDWELEGDYGESYGSYGRLIAQGTTMTDDQGRAFFQVPADIAEEISSRRFTIEVNVYDINQQVVSQRTATVVHKGEFYVGVAPEYRVAQAGTAQEIALLTADWDSLPVGSVDLDVVVMEHRWYSVRQEAEDGYAYWTWTTEDIPVYTTTARTNGQGEAAITFTPESSGSYRIRATAEDDLGNEIRSSTYLWVWGGRETIWRRESTNRIDLITDRDAYAVGDVAEILIPSPYSGTVQALITIERGHVLETEVRELAGSTEVLRIPIRETYVPNVYVSVILMQGSAQSSEALASFKMGEVVLAVSTETKQLQITLTPDRDVNAGAGTPVHYRPRETAIYDVLVTDNEGNPVEAELSLRLADLSVLALADEVGPTLLERFWSERGLGVRTSMPLAVAMEAYSRELAPGAKGGGGGGGGMEDGFIRTRFADTAFWEAVVHTGADGRARVEVELPDNLTTWRMQARAITEETLVGRGEVDIRTTLDLLVRPGLPRFFVVGDQAEISTIVHNNTADDVSAEVVIAVDGLALEGPSEQQVGVPAGGQVKVVWPVTVLPGDEVTVRMEARGGSLFDGREDTLPVYHYATPEVVATAGRLSEPEARQEVIQLPAAFDASQGELTVQVDGSLTAATQDALGYLDNYPYECVEQTVSRFLPNVLTYQALEEMGISRPELEGELRSQVSLSLQRLYNEQHYDGGWGWWVSDESDSYLTAYVLQGLLEAHRAGFTVDDNVISEAAAFLRENLPSLPRQADAWRANRVAYQLYVLGEYVTLIDDAEPAGELNRAIKLFGQRTQLDQYGKAMLAVALGLLEPEEDRRVKTLMSDQVGDIVISATGAHWEEASPDYWNMNTDTRTTAIVLWAMARHNPESELLPNVVRWLMTVRREGYWESTNTTSWSLMGLIAYMRATGELQGDFSFTVMLNSEVLLTGDVNEETIDESRQIQVEIAQLLVDRGNRLIIEREPASSDQADADVRDGEGQLYYTAHMRYFLPAEEVKALDRGIIVARQYSPVDAPETYVNEARVGDIIRVKLTVVAPTDLYYVTVEDPLPAGFEAVDVTLNTTSVVGQAPTVRNLTAEEEDTWYRWYGWGWWWFSHSEMRDEKVTLFSSYLPRGTYEYSYVMRATLPGTYNVIPSTAYEMYFPEVFGRSDGGTFTVIGE